MWGIGRIAAIGLLGLLATEATAQTTGKNPSHADILRGFDVAALYADKSQNTTGYGSGATLTGTVMKWTRPVRYRVDGMTYDKTRIAETIDTLKRVAAIAGVPVSEGTGTTANFILVFRNSDNMRASNGGRVGCLTSWNGNHWTGAFTTVEMQINLAMQYELTHCINHEMLHAFGLRGHPHKLHSVMSYYTARFVFDPTEADIVMLQTLYDKRMKPGMSRLAAVVLADELIEEKRRALNPAAPPRTESTAVFQEIIADLEVAAKAGDARAILSLAEAHRFGIVLPKDDVKMQALIEQAAQLLDPGQRFDTAYALAAGHFVPQDAERAAILYRRNAESGHLVSQNNLAILLRDGKGVSQDMTEALMWFTIAAGKYDLAERNRQNLLDKLAPDIQQTAHQRATAWKLAAEAAR
jgi:hypothetical protein